MKILYAVAATREKYTMYSWGSMTDNRIYLQWIVYDILYSMFFSLAEKHFSMKSYEQNMVFLSSSDIIFERKLN